MKHYLHCSYDECVARASAYHRAGHDWARAALAGGRLDKFPPPRVFELAQAHDREAIISAAGLLAETHSYMVDCAEGDLALLDDSDKQAHVDAAVMYAAQGLHCEAGDHRTGVDWMRGSPCCTSVFASALLGDWFAIRSCAEAASAT